MHDHPDPVGFGFYNRAWAPRSQYAGTYDDQWRKTRRPRYPEDFDFRYYNGAHPDLQIDGYLQGDEAVELKNLTRDGYIKFNLPAVRPTCRVQFQPEKDDKRIKMNLDTLFLEPDKYSLCMVWRGAIALAEVTDAEILMINTCPLNREVQKSA